MKRYILFAGCNGVGKSTLYQTNEMFREMPRVNMDEIVREFGSWKNEADAFKAGKIAIAKERIRGRVLKGGHGIPDADVERRFIESIENLQKAIQLCNVVEVFDNTETFIRVARFECGRCVLRTEDAPDWVP